MAAAVTRPYGRVVLSSSSIDGSHLANCGRCEKRLVILYGEETDKMWEIYCLIVSSLMHWMVGEEKVGPLVSYEGVLKHESPCLVNEKIPGGIFGDMPPKWKGGISFSGNRQLLILEVHLLEVHHLELVFLTPMIPKDEHHLFFLVHILITSFSHGLPLWYQGYLNLLQPYPCFLVLQRCVRSRWNT